MTCPYTQKECEHNCSTINQCRNFPYRFSYVKKLILSLAFLLFSTLASAQNFTITHNLASEIVQKEAVILWFTSYQTRSILYVGTSSTNLTPYTEDNNYILEHKIKLLGLNPGTKYFYKIKSTSPNGYNRTSSVYNFTTGGRIGSSDTIAPSIPQNVYAQKVSATEVTISWDTCVDNSKIAGYIIWGRTGSVVKTTTGNKYNYLKVKKLSPSTLYYKENGPQSSFMVQSYDVEGNISGPSQRVWVQTPSLDVSNPPILINNNSFSSKVNPTRQPIGGGWGYTDLIYSNQANYIVSNKEELKEALTNAISNEIIYIADTCSIDLTGESLSIPHGVTLASGRGNGLSEGALLYSNSLYPNILAIPMLYTGGDSVTITGLRMRGPNPDILDHDFELGVANAIRCKNANLTVHNCELWAWDKWAIWLYISKNAYIHHNYIHHSLRNGYGYGVWQGGAGSEINSYAIIEANLFEALRHVVGSSGHMNSWESKYNVILRRQLYNNFDRHNVGGTKTGGKNTILKSNLFFSTQTHYGLALPKDTTGIILIENNYFTNDSITAGYFGATESEKDTVIPMVTVKNNFYRYEGRELPSAIIYSNVSSGTIPLKVNFDASGSFHEKNIPITKFAWRFGDGDYRGNEKREIQTSYTFTQPGVYNVTLVVYDAYGIPSNPVNKTIIVYPKSNLGKYVLSAWIKDTYTGNLTGKYQKQLIVNDEIVWSDDVVGNEGWQHIVIDISRFGNAGTSHRIGFRMIALEDVDSESEISELYMWIDDVVVFNSNILNYSFEDAVMSPWRQTFNIPPGGPSISSAITTEERRSGEKSFRLRFPFRKDVIRSTWGEVYQQIIFK